MKILFNCVSMGKGGAERVLSILANHFSNDNEVTIVSMLNKDSSYDLNTNVKLIKLKGKVESSKLKKILSKISIKKILDLKNTIIDEKPDIVVSFLPEPTFRLMLLKKIYSKIKKIPIVISIRVDPNVEFKNKIVRKLMLFLYKSCDGLVLQTDDMKKFFDEYPNHFKNKTIIPNPVNEDFFEKEYKGLDSKTIVSVGRLVEQKNYPLLIEAFNMFHNTYSDYDLVIYGEGQKREELNKIIKEKNLDECVLIKNNVNNLQEIIPNYKLFVLTSNWEGMPNALMEAMTIGMPCIATDCKGGGAKFLIDNQKTGILTKRNDVVELANAFKDLVNNKDLMKKISINAKQKMSNYKPDIIAKIWFDYINNVIKDSNMQ